MKSSLKWHGRALALIAAGAVILSGCAVEGEDEPTGSDSNGAVSENLTVYATTMYLADIVENIAPEAEVTTMVGPGADPHTYQLSTKDIEDLTSADAVLWNGLNLEAVAGDVLMDQGRRQFAAAEALDTADLLPWEEDASRSEMYDPHVWNDPELWAQVVDHTAEFLGETNPEGRDEYLANAQEYRQEILDAHQWAQEQMDTIEDEQRLLITGHDAFGYLGRTYDLEIRATDFVSSEAELSAAELSELAGIIAERDIPMIFHDNQKNPQAIRSLQEAVTARGGNVEISEHELFADSMGATAPVDTYLGSFEHNISAITEALGEDTE